jgi:hypothetical protein
MVALKEELVLLSEGLADKAFLARLVASRGPLPAFDFPFPNDQLFGRSQFGTMLRALRGDPSGFSRLKGVLIVSDSADDAQATFDDIADQIRAAGGYTVPAAPLQIGAATADHPAVAVMLLPDENNPGALESLYVRDLTGRHGWLGPCLDTFLGCGQSQALGWSPEKLAKAKFACCVAAVHEDDPSRAASAAYRNPPVIHIAAACFNDVASKIRDFCNVINGP